MLIRVESCWRCGWYRGISVADWAGADRFRESPLFSIRCDLGAYQSGSLITNLIRKLYRPLGSQVESNSK